MDFIIRSLIVAAIMFVVFILGMEWQSLPFAGLILGFIFILSNIALDRYVEMKSEKKKTGTKLFILTGVALIILGAYSVQYFLQNQDGQINNQQQIAQESTSNATPPLYNEQDLKPLIDAHTEMIKRAWAEKKRIRDASSVIFESNGDLVCNDRLVSKKYGWTIDNGLFVNKDGLFFYPESCLIIYKREN